jgi:hypothetical protein
VKRQLGAVQRGFSDESWGEGQGGQQDPTEAIFNQHPRCNHKSHYSRRGLHVEPLPAAKEPPKQST